MKRNRYRPLRLECLEVRDVPTVYGVPWADPHHLTVSFAPDSTQVGSQSSQLSQSLGTNLTGAAWQGALLKAVQTWASQGNVNVAYVADSGTAFGSAGPAQGDSRFGDIRFGAVALSNNELALANPYQVQIGSWSGDILFNTHAQFGDGTKGTYDLYTVALHEVGHAFGIDDNNSPDSAMYHDYAGVRTGLSSADVANFQALYGAPPQVASPAGVPGTREFAHNRETKAKLLSTGKKFNSVLLAANPTTTSDVDYYQFTASQQGTTVSIGTTRHHVLTADLTVYDADKHAIGDVSNFDPTRSGPLSLNLSLTAGQTYFVRVQSAPGMSFGEDSYQLTVGTTNEGAPSDDLAQPTPAPAAAAANGGAYGSSYLVTVPQGVGGQQQTLGIAAPSARHAPPPPAASDLTTVGATTLNQSQTQSAQSLTINRTELYHFVLGATGNQGLAGVRMTIYDANGAPVASVVTLTGLTAAANVWLTEGTYTVVYASATLFGSPLQDLAVTLRLAEESDPIGPYLIDPTTMPTPSTGSPPATLPPPPSAMMLAPTTPPPLTAPVCKMPPPPPPPPAYVFVTLPGSKFLTITDPYGTPFWY